MRAFTCNDETRDKKITNCSPYFTALQYINNLEPKRSNKREVNLKNITFVTLHGKTYTNDLPLNVRKLTDT